MPMDAEVAIIPLEASHFAGVISVADEQLGEGFFTPDSLARHVAQSTPADGTHSASMVAVRSNAVVGFRIVILPGQWVPATSYIACTPSKWPCEPTAVAFGVAIAVDPSCTGQGIGSLLFTAVNSALRGAGCLGLVAHIWASSASAVALAKRQGALFIAEHPAAWAALPASYRCSVCAPKGFLTDQCDGVEVFYVIQPERAIALPEEARH
jgi:GNAT superfamily N-acetyltransferase